MSSAGLIPTGARPNRLFPGVGWAAVTIATPTAFLLNWKWRPARLRALQPDSWRQQLFAPAETTPDAKGIFATVIRLRSAFRSQSRQCVHLRLPSKDWLAPHLVGPHIPLLRHLTPMPPRWRCRPVRHHVLGRGIGQAVRCREIRKVRHYHHRNLVEASSLPYQHALVVAEVHVNEFSVVHAQCVRVRPKVDQPGDILEDLLPERLFQTREIHGVHLLAAVFGYVAVRIE